MNHDKMTNISAKRGFLWPSFEIYSGVSGFTDYGPLGASLKNNIMQKWRKPHIFQCSRFFVMQFCIIFSFLACGRGWDGFSLPREIL